MSIHELDEYGWCRLCDQKIAIAESHCPVAHAFKAWLLSPASPSAHACGGLRVKDVMTPTETNIARQAFIAGRRSIA